MICAQTGKMSIIWLVPLTKKVIDLEETKRKIVRDPINDKPNPMTL